MLKKRDEFLPEIQKPITMTIDEIKQDMNNYAKNFPIDQIPHISENDDIVDPIHNYRRPKPSKKEPKPGNQLETVRGNNALAVGVPTLTERQI